MPIYIGGVFAAAAIYNGPDYGARKWVDIGLILPPLFFFFGLYKGFTKNNGAWFFLIHLLLWPLFGVIYFLVGNQISFFRLLHPMFPIAKHKPIHISYLGFKIIGRNSI
jgi:hypothetical protein